MLLATTLSRISTHPHSENPRIAAGSKSKNKLCKATIIDIMDTDKESNTNHKDAEAPEDVAEDSEVELSQ
jgi:hypothetical protein